jgi:hypothetical protein
LLRWLWLVGVPADRLRFRYRLVGTGHRDAIGADLSGRWIDVVFPDFPRFLRLCRFRGGHRRRDALLPSSAGIPGRQGLVQMERVLLLARHGVNIDTCCSGFPSSRATTAAWFRGL